MSQPLVSYWPAGGSNPNIIAAPQAFFTAGSMVLNYNGPQALSVPAFPSFTMPGMVRSVSLSSAEDLSGAEFTITGLGCPGNQIAGAGSVYGEGNPLGLCNQPISETISGPNTSPVWTNAIFSRVDSIFAVTGTEGADISAGYGRHGITAYQFLDVDRISWNAAYQAQYIQTAGDPTLTYSLYVSLTRPYEFIESQGTIIFPPQKIAANKLVDAAETTNFGVLANPVYIIWARCDESEADSTDEFYLTTLQTGIRS